MNHSSDPSFDSDVEWLSIKEREKPNQVLPKLLVLGGVFLSLITTFVFFSFVFRRARMADENVTVTRLRSTAHLQREATQAFGGFDASSDILPGIPLENVGERQAIESLLNKLRECAAAEDSEQFRQYVDHHKLLKRIELGGYLDGYNRFDKGYLRTQLKQNVFVDSYWTDLIVVRAIVPQDDPDTRVLYGYGLVPNSDEHSDIRLIIGWDGDVWKLYDWERLDQGIHCSEEWGIYAKHNGTSLYDGFSRWSDLLNEANHHLSNGDYEGAAEKLRQAETQQIPPESEGYCWLTNGYFWQAVGQRDEALRCFLRIPQPKETPGAYIGLMDSYRWKDPAKSVEYGKRYQQCVGPNLDLCEAVARVYQQLGQEENALAEWKKILRIEPDHTVALQAVLVALPAKEKSRFESILARQEDPKKTAASVAQFVVWRDPNAIDFLKNYLDNNAPQSAESHFVTGLAAQSKGNLEQAADAFLLAFQTEQDETARDGYVENFVNAMSSIGRGVEAWEKAPNKQSIFDVVVDEYLNFDSQFTDEELEEISTQYIREYPDSIVGYYFLAQLAEQEGRLEEAEQFIREGLSRPPDSDPNSSQTYNSETLNYLLTNVLFQQGRYEAAYNLTEEKQDRFNQLCRLATQVGNWGAVQAFLEMHREYQTNDPQWHYYQGELAASKQYWNSAIEALQQARSLADDNARMGFDSRLMQYAIAAGNWGQQYESSDKQEEAFASLAREFISTRDWKGLQQLASAHRIKHQSDPQLTRHLADAAWAQGNYSTFAELVTKLLESEDDAFGYSYTKDAYKRQLLTALLKTGNTSEAQRLAAKRERESNTTDHLAIVAAATGNHRRAQQLAIATAQKDQGATAFYHSEAAGPVFLGKEYNELQQKYPEEVPYDFNTVRAVFLSASPWQLDTDQIASALETIGESDKQPVPLVSHREEVSGSFAVHLDDCAVWLAMGSGPFDEGWDFEGETHPLLTTANENQHWLAVGTVALAEIQNREAARVARRLAGELAKERSRLFCIEDLSSWRSLRIYPTHHDSVSHWIQSGVVPLVHGRGLSLNSWRKQASVAGDREHKLALTQVARQFESPAGSPLEVLEYCVPEIKAGVLRIQVENVKHEYGSLQFVGQLADESDLFPPYRKDLPFRVNLMEVGGWKLGAEAPVYRED